MAVDWQHPQYKNSIQRWRDIDNVILRENMKSYIRKLNPEDTSYENKIINQDYRDHAIFYNFTTTTLRGLVGEVYDKPPQIELPQMLEYLNDDADGKGNSITQISQKSLREVLKKGRNGLLTTFPKVDRELSTRDTQTSSGRAIITPIDAKRIINWRDGPQGLSLLVFRDDDQIIDPDGFGFEHNEAYTVLSLEEEIYVHRHWAKNDKDDWVITAESFPLDGLGNHWDQIPFCFVGSVNNDSDVDRDDMIELAEINIGHYRNSADFEDNIFYCGQSQPWMSGLTDSWIDLMKREGLFTSTKKLMAVPPGEKYAHATAAPNPMARQGMLDKIEMAQSIGARFVQRGGVAKTAEQSSGEQKVAHSPLSLAAKNVSEAYRKSIDFVAQYMNTTSDGSVFVLNDDFIPVGTSPEEIKQVVEQWSMSGMPDDDYVRYMQKAERFDPNKTIEQLVDQLNALRDFNAGDI